MFVINDECIVKCIFEMLGIVIELCVQCNYVGYWFVLWLGYLMVLCQEMVCLLLMLGEVMQLLFDEVVVMVFSVVLIKVKKLCYYVDVNFKWCVLLFFVLVNGWYVDVLLLCFDDWSGLVIFVVFVVFVVDIVECFGVLIDDGGLCCQFEFLEIVVYDFELVVFVVDFGLFDDDDDLLFFFFCQFDLVMQCMVWLVFFDFNDGIEL